MQVWLDSVHPRDVSDRAVDCRVHVCSACVIIPRKKKERRDEKGRDETKRDETSWAQVQVRHNGVAAAENPHLNARSNAGDGGGVECCSE